MSLLEMVELSPRSEEVFHQYDDEAGCCLLCNNLFLLARHLGRADGLDAMGLRKEQKIVLHIGGIYGDKTAVLKRFIHQYRCLDENIWQRLVIENDDRQ